MAKGRVNLGLEAGAMSAVAGMMDGFSATLQTDRMVTSVLGYVQSELSKEFELAVDAAARAAPGSFLHVYEWGDTYDYEHSNTIGDPANRLWKITSVGRGKTRAMSFVFLPSVRPVPINPILEGRVREGVHVFTWKAPMMEYGMRVTVRRKPGTRSLIFVDNQTDEIRYAPGPYSFNVGTSPYGKPNQRRVFTSFFISWWETKAPELFEGKLRRQIEQDIGSPKKWDNLIRKFKSKPKTFTIQTTLQGHRNFAQARAAARKELLAVGKQYDQKAVQGRLGKYGY